MLIRLYAVALVLNLSNPSPEFIEEGDVYKIRTKKKKPGAPATPPTVYANAASCCQTPVLNIPSPFF